MRPALLLFCLIVSSPVVAQVNLIALHGKVWTENPAQPQAQAIAIAGHRILAVGTDAEISKFITPATKWICTAAVSYPV